MVPCLSPRHPALTVAAGVGLVVCVTTGCGEAIDTPFFERGGDAGTGGIVSTGGTGAGTGGDASGGMSGTTATGGSDVVGGTGSGGTAGQATGGVSGTDATGGTGGVVVDCGAVTGAVAYEGHCYLLLTMPRIWADARQDCSMRGAHLVTMGSANRTEAEVKAENDFVWQLGGMMEQWIGATDGRMSNQSGNGMPYMWITGEPFTYDLWSGGQPNNEQAACQAPPAPCSCGDQCWAHCAFQWAPNDNEIGTWNDRHCEHLLPYVCEWDSAPN